MNTILKFAFLAAFVFVSFLCMAGINKQSAYIESYNQRTEIEANDVFPTVKTSYDIVFKFNDEKAVTLYHNYTIYFSSFETLEKIEVYTKNPQSNGKMKTIEIKDFKMTNSKSNSIFYDDEKEININFLGLTVGSEAHVKYTVSTNEAHFTEPMSFAYYLPIQERKYELVVPKNVNISIIEKNILPNTFQFKKEERKNNTLYTWLATDIEEDKPMDGLPARMSYIPHVLYKIDDYTYEGVNYSISKSPKDLFNWYVKSIKHINTEPSEKLKVLADSITKGSLTQKEKVKKVYDWVKKNIRYVAFENGMEGLVPREGELVCNRRYGDCKDMSSLQFALLKAINVPAYLTWIGTRRIPYSYSEVPLKNTDNHMIASTKIDGEWYFLDATDPNGIFGIPPDHIQGKQAMIYKNDEEFELVTVPVVEANKNTFFEINKMKLEGTNVQVNTSSTYKGLLAGSISNRLLYLTENEKQEYGKGLIKGITNNAVLKTFDVAKQTNDNEINYSIDFQMKSYAKEVDDEMYINVLLDRTLNSFSIDELNRKIPFSLSYNSQHEIEYYLQIPDNYKVEYLPENLSINEKEYGATISYKTENNELICKQKVFVNTSNLLIEPKQFDAWNTFIKKLNKSYKESIVLKKK